MLSPFFAQSEHIFYSLFPKVLMVKVCPHVTLYKSKSKIEMEPAIMILQVEMLSSNFRSMDHFFHPQAPPSKCNLPHTRRITLPPSRHWPITTTISPHICKTITVYAFTSSTTKTSAATTVRIFNHSTKSSHSILCTVTWSHKIILQPGYVPKYISGSGRKDWSIFPYFGPVSCL